MARPNKSGLTYELWRQYKMAGLSNKDIAERHDVSQAYVSQVKFSKTSPMLTPREKARQFFPWRIPQRLHGSYQERMIADHLEYMATLGKGMTKEKLDRLRRFYQNMQDKVIEYSPSIEPNESAARGGFRYLPRESDDGNMLIRANDHTSLSEEGAVMLSFPKRLP